MDLKVQKRLAAQILKSSPKRVVFDNDRLDDIKQAITNRDLKLLIGDHAITLIPARGVSRSRANKLKTQKNKGRRKGPGSKKGKFAAHFKPKLVWMNTVRVQREFLNELVTKKIVTKKAYRELYLKSKGGFFRSRRHIKLYLEEHDELLTAKQGTVSEASTKKTVVKKSTAKKSK